MSSSLKRLLWSSLIVAGFAFGLPCFYTTSPHFGAIVRLSYIVSGIWALLVVYSWLNNGRKAAWLLIGLPLSLVWPTVMLWLDMACRFSRDCI
jgi:hypothetical protein